MKEIFFLKLFLMFSSITLDPDPNKAKILNPDPNRAKIQDPQRDFSLKNHLGLARHVTSLFEFEEISISKVSFYHSAAITSRHFL